MKRYKYIIIVFLSLLILSTSFYFFIPKNDDIEINLEQKNINTEYVDKIENIKNTENIVYKKDVPVSDEIDNINVTVNILDKNYVVKVKDGSSVLDVMKKAQSQGLSFKGKDYKTMGFFVEEINEVSNSPGGYWIYYVNDKQAEIGISKYIIREGDIINWKLE